MYISLRQNTLHITKKATCNDFSINKILDNVDTVC